MQDKVTAREDHDAKRINKKTATNTHDNSSDGSVDGDENQHNNNNNKSDMNSSMAAQTQQPQDKASSSTSGEDNKDANGDVAMEDAEDGEEKRTNSDNGQKEEEKKEGGGDKDTTAAANGSASNKSGEEKAKAPAAASSSPPPPVLKGTLSYNEELRRHLIRGMWNYENSSTFPPQRFELLRKLDDGEDPKELPKDGEFHGSFSLAYFHTTSKGKQKERSKVIPETGVKIKFTKLTDSDKENTFQVDGRGTNQFGIFHINGTACPSDHDDGQYTIELRKRYEPSTQPAAAAAEDSTAKKNKKRKMGPSTAGADLSEVDDGPLPPPSQSYEKHVVCLRGKIYKEESEELGLGTGEVVHRINGWWSSGLDLILADPQNVQGLCNRFEYEHKTSAPSGPVPLSGRYSGWFDLNIEDGSKKKILEKDVTLKFRKNNAGYHNVEGRGSNAFGKYSITGTLTLDNVITIFRHFQTKKSKSLRPVTSAPQPINNPEQSRRPSLPAAPDPQLKLDEVKEPDEEGDNLEALKPPEHGTYSAVSRGVLRLNEDGSVSCQGKWAVSRELFTNGTTSNFTFRLEAHFTADALKHSNGRQFPLDSERYKGSFQFKKGSSRYQTIIDQQVVMKFRKNNTGAYNVYGKGVNSIGVFNLTGTLIMSGKTGGQVELYRMYPPELLTQTTPATKVATPLASVGKTPSMPGSEIPPTNFSSQTAVAAAVPPARGMGRRESTRLVKVPSRLEDDDPSAQLERTMEKCKVILRFIREKDVERGAFFSEPVDPVALNIPTYSQVISEPMDLKTLSVKMEADEVESPEEFGRLCRLVFENAMTFNVDPRHSVHQAARTLLILFNQKFRDIERQLTNLRRNQGDDKKGKKGDKKRKRDEPRTLKQLRLEEAQEMSTSNSNALQAIVSAIPSTGNINVTRNEFNQMINLVRQMQSQIVQTYTILAEMSSDVEMAPPTTTALEIMSSVAPSSEYVPSASPPPEKKKPPPKRKPEPKVFEKPPVVSEDDNTPLTPEEQVTLTETINELPGDQIQVVIQIIREAAKLGDDEDEIDIEIDQLDASTQRKLLKHVTKFIKQPKRQSKVKGAKKKAAPPPKKTQPPPAKKAKASPPPAPAPAPSKKDPDSLFAFGNKEDSESDSESEGEISSPAPAPVSADPAPAAGTASKTFNLGGGFGDEDDDDDDDDDLDSEKEEDDLQNGAPAAWNISKPVNDSKNKSGDDDDGWGAARDAAAAAKAREADKKKREEKMKAEAEQLKAQRLADAVAHGEEIKAQREAEQEEEERRKEEEEKEAEEARRKVREELRAQTEGVVQTVDMDAQRDIMKQYEQNFMDKEMGGASPSSDFGF